LLHSEHKNDAYGLSLQGNWRVMDANQITTGYEFHEDKINSTDVRVQKRTAHSWFVQDQIKLPAGRLGSNFQVSLLPAIRLDKFTNIDTQFSPKLAFLVNYVSGWQLVLRGNWGKSYRLPSFNDLYWPSDPFSVGNPNLLPEKGLGYDFGSLMNFRAAGFWTFEINYFNTRLENLIIWGPRPDGIFSPDNVQEADLTGVETRAAFQDLGRLVNLSVNYNYLDAVDRSDDPALSGKQLIYRPKNKVDVNLGLNFGRLELNALWRFVDKRFANAGNADHVDAYDQIDFGATWSQAFLRGRLRMQVEVRNAFDDQTDIIQGFPMPGREYRTALGFDF
ncbi:MAG TPA: TonB-dependent receptor, partial [bacterium]